MVRNLLWDFWMFVQFLVFFPFVLLVMLPLGRLDRLLGTRFQKPLVVMFKLFANL
jgi:hypothetical protein